AALVPAAGRFDFGRDGLFGDSCLHRADRYRRRVSVAGSAENAPARAGALVRGPLTFLLSLDAEVRVPILRRAGVCLLGAHARGAGAEDDSGQRALMWYCRLLGRRRRVI